MPTQNYFPHQLAKYLVVWPCLVGALSSGSIFLCQSFQPSSKWLHHAGLPEAVAEDSFALYPGWHLVFGEDLAFFHCHRCVGAGCFLVACLPLGERCLLQSLSAVFDLSLTPAF